MTVAAGITTLLEIPDDILVRLSYKIRGKGAFCLSTLQVISYFPRVTLYCVDYILSLSYVDNVSEHLS